MNKKQKYWQILAVLVFVIFFLNSRHLNQQVTYEQVFRPIASNLLHGSGYQCEFLNNEPAFYPLWGYTFLVAVDNLLGSANIFIVLVQIILCELGIALFYKIFQIRPKLIHIPLLLPFIAFMSVRWPDAIVGFLLIAYMYCLYLFISQGKLKYAIISGIIIGLTVNFRPEYLYLPVVNVVLLFIPSFKVYRKRIVISTATALLIAFVLLLPWAFRSYKLTGEPRFSASNGGAVFIFRLDNCRVIHGLLSLATNLHIILQKHIMKKIHTLRTQINC
jgi:4-amino-4-deoxy-L-arabinose transferase-like glycosyltransferase